jgi:hypothetical protein
MRLRFQPGTPCSAAAAGPDTAEAGTDSVAAMHCRSHVPGCEGNAKTCDPARRTQRPFANRVRRIERVNPTRTA